MAHCIDSSITADKSELNKQQEHTSTVGVKAKHLKAGQSYDYLLKDSVTQK